MSGHDCNAGDAESNRSTAVAKGHMGTQEHTAQLRVSPLSNQHNAGIVSIIAANDSPVVTSAQAIKQKQQCKLDQHIKPHQQQQTVKEVDKRGCSQSPSNIAA